MRKTVLVAMVACCVGFAVATMTAHAYTKLNAWQTHGAKFQLGYVVGYIDAVKLAKFKDTRATIPTAGRARHQDWLRRVNEFYENPANVERPVPDAMLVVGQQYQEEILRTYKERRDRILNAAKAAKADAKSGTAVDAAADAADDAADSAPE